MFVEEMKQDRKSDEKFCDYFFCCCVGRSHVVLEMLNIYLFFFSLCFIPYVHKRCFFLRGYDHISISKSKEICGIINNGLVLNE